jgi:phosphoribosyl 1,2-cyclic phosphate phosphodiesterase
VLLTFLGTAASEGYPNAFCGCDNCRDARAAGGPSLRKRSSALLDDELLIDLGPDLMAASQAHGVPLHALRYCLQTHDHEDHLDPSHLLSRSAACGVPNVRLLEYYASSVSLAKCAAALNRHAPLGTLADPAVEEKLRIRAVQIEPGGTYDVGPYRVTVVPAAHAPEALLFLIERDGRRLFYGTDTGPLPEAAWALLGAAVAAGGPIHVAVLDHTFGMRGRSSGHMNWEQFVEQVARMREAGLLAADARVLAHHLGHHSNPAHDRLAAFAAERGYAVAYDGLRLTV